MGDVCRASCGYSLLEMGTFDFLSFCSSIVRERPISFVSFSIVQKKIYFFLSQNDRSFTIYFFLLSQKDCSVKPFVQWNKQTKVFKNLLEKFVCSVKKKLSLFEKFVPKNRSFSKRNYRIFQVCSTILKSFFFHSLSKNDHLFISLKGSIPFVYCSFISERRPLSRKILFVLKNVFCSKKTIPLFTHHSFDMIQVKLKIEVVLFCCDVLELAFL